MIPGPALEPRASRGRLGMEVVAARHCQTVVERTLYERMDPLEGVGAGEDLSTAHTVGERRGGVLVESRDRGSNPQGPAHAEHGHRLGKRRRIGAECFDSGTDPVAHRRDCGAADVVSGERTVAAAADCSEQLAQVERVATGRLVKGGAERVVRVGEKLRTSSAVAPPRARGGRGGAPRVARAPPASRPPRPARSSGR